METSLRSDYRVVVVVGVGTVVVGTVVVIEVGVTVVDVVALDAVVVVLTVVAVEVVELTVEEETVVVVVGVGRLNNLKNQPNRLNLLSLVLRKVSIFCCSAPNVFNCSCKVVLVVGLVVLSISCSILLI